MIQNILDSLGNTIGTLTVDDLTPAETVQSLLGLYSSPFNLSEVRVLASYNASATGSVTTSSQVVSIIGGMTLVPPKGEYVVIYSGDINTSGVNAAGQYGIYKDAVLVDDTRRSVSCSLSLLGGLVSISLNAIGVGTYTGTRVSVDGANVLDVRFNSANGGTIGFGNRSFMALKVL